MTLDGDGRQELIATEERKEGDKPNWLSNELCWLKPIDPLAGKWEKFPIGTGIGDWPHGSVVAPILPDGKLALVTTYHSAPRRRARGRSPLSRTLGNPRRSFARSLAQAAAGRDPLR